MADAKRNRPAGNGAAPKTSGRDSTKGSAPTGRNTRTALAGANPYQLAEALAGPSVLCDTPRFRCPSCRTREAYPVPAGWRCTCGSRGTVYGLRHLVARDRTAVERLVELEVTV